MDTVYFEPAMLTALHRSTEVPKFEAPPTLSFRLLGEPTIEDRRLSLAAALDNVASTGTDIVVFPIGGVEPFYLELVADGNVTRVQPTGPVRPAAPPPPMALTVPPRSTLRFLAVQSLVDYRYEGSPTVRLRWSFQYWLNPLSGEVSVVLPSR